MSTPFDDIVKAYQQALSLPEPEITASPISSIPPTDNAPCCLICSPHPDDESLVGGLALRMRHQEGWRVVNLAITLGSQVERRIARWHEAQAACHYLGFELASPLNTQARSFENITVKAFESQSPQWLDCVAKLANQLQVFKPRMIIFPHAMDGHTTHCATYHLLMQALPMAKLKDTCHLLLSEYWNTQMSPRLMLALSPSEVSQMMTATAMHSGEVKRNPYHRSLPAWLIDGARRGAERVGLPGQAATGMAMAALYGWLIWDGELRDGPKALVKLGDPMPDFLMSAFPSN